MQRLRNAAGIWCVLLASTAAGLNGCAGSSAGGGRGLLAKPIDTLTETGRTVKDTTYNGVNRAWNDTVSLLSFGAGTPEASPPAAPPANAHQETR